MRLNDTINLHGGGPGSGCNPGAGKCGRTGKGLSKTESDRLKSYKQEIEEHKREQKELAKPAKKMAATLKLPGGAGVEYRDGSYHWEKRGGYFNKFGDVERAAAKAGFKLKDTRATGSPDGSYMGGAIVLEHPSGWELSWHKTYGVVKSDNWFQIDLKKTK